MALLAKEMKVGGSVAKGRVAAAVMGTALQEVAVKGAESEVKDTKARVGEEEVELEVEELEVADSGAEVGAEKGRD